METKSVKIVPVIYVLIIIALFRVLLFLFASYSFYVYNEKVEKDLPLSTIINFTFIFPPIILLVEAATYYFLRKRNFLRRPVNLHIWTTFFSSFFIPLVGIIVIYFILPSYLSKKSMVAVSRQTDYYLGNGMWILFWLARLFFIIAIRKSVTSVKEQDQTDNSAGFLNEFSDQSQT